MCGLFLAQVCIAKYQLRADIILLPLKCDYMTIWKRIYLVPPGLDLPILGDHDVVVLRRLLPLVTRVTAPPRVGALGGFLLALLE